ncbi:hypothetical protein P692DRAFT_20474646 [Suillus brevipes Sb2]|nr:hypothetical protein P692DRAFT_20474646 [Suillus brevipes Sb2]
MQRPKVVEVYAVRGFKRLAVTKRVGRSKLPESTCSIPLAAPHANSSSPAGFSSQDYAQPCPSSQAGSAQPSTSSMVSVTQARPSSYAMVGHAVQYSQAASGSSSHIPTPRPIATAHTDYYADSSSSINGSCNRFLDRICFPCGHYHEDS